MSLAEVESPIFVGGSGRSGTTIVGRTLGLHPNVYNFPDEPKFLFEMPGSLLEYLHAPDDSKLRTNFEKGMRSRFFRRWSDRAQRNVGLCASVERPHYLTCLDRFVSEFPAPDLEERYLQVRRFLADLYAPTLAAQGKRRWCDDSPLCVLYQLDVFEIWPDARVLHVVRDGRHVAQSYCRLGWCSTMPEALRLWHSRLSLARRLGAAAPEGRYLEVSLSKLTEQPEEEVRRILSFVGEPWDEAMRNHNIRRRRSEKYLGPVSGRDERLFRALAADLVEEFGWSGASPPVRVLKGAGGSSGRLP